MIYYHHDGMSERKHGGLFMNILTVSDSHGRVEMLREAIRLTDPDAVLFAGDGLRDLDGLSLSCPLYAVRGNCDWDVTGGRYAEEELVTLAGVRILLTHGHRQGVKHGLGAAVAYAERCRADVLVFGHTHEAIEIHAGPDVPPGAHTLRASRPLLLCNPGSVGFYPHTFGTLTVQAGQVLFGIGRIG